MKNLILTLPLLLAGVASIPDSKPLYETYDNTIPVSSVWDSTLKAPYDTNAFFENLVVKTGNLPIDLFPYLLRVESGSQGIGISTDTDNRITRWNVTTKFELDWAIFSQTGKFDSHNVVKYDKLSVTLKFSIQDGSVRLPLVRGSAYVSMMVNNIKPIFYTARDIQNVTYANGTEVTQFGTADQFVITLGTGKVWALYLYEPTKIQRALNQIRFQSFLNGNIRFAYIGDDTSALSIYD